MKKLIIAGLTATALLAGGAVTLHHSGTNVAEARVNAKSIVDAVYTRLARDQNVRSEVVARLTGEKQIEKAAKGEYVLDGTGQWTRK